MTDPDHPLVVDSRLLHRQPGSSLRLERVVTVGEPIGDEVAGVRAEEQCPVDLLLESVQDGILVAGSCQVPVSGLCVRCLDEYSDVIDVSFQQFFAYPEMLARGTDDDVAEMNGPWLDVRAAFHDALVLALPLSPTCRPDCPGLCAECGFRLADDPTHGHAHQDPRWSALATHRRQPGGE